jgi:NADPH:quinone reductase-like Zn-dependent oxidoreductase
VLVRLHNAALNHRDILDVAGTDQRKAEGIILGSDGSGVIETGRRGRRSTVDWSRSIINPSLEWGANPIVQGNSFKILGYPDNGTFSDYIVISKKYVF